MRGLGRIHRRARLDDSVAVKAYEMGMKEFDFGAWQGVLAPAGTPRAIVARLNGEINKVLKDRKRAARSSESQDSRRSAGRPSSSRS